MRARMESMVLIDRPVDDVFRFLLDLETALPAVDRDVAAVERTPPGSIGVGTTFAVRRTGHQPFGRGPRRDTIRYTAVEPNRRIAFVGRFGPIAPTAQLTFAPTNGGTRVLFRGTPNPVGPLRLLTPLLARVGQRMWHQRLARIKTLLEKPGGHEHGP